MIRSGGNILVEEASGTGFFYFGVSTEKLEKELLSLHNRKV
jgi:hypothetical protein